MNTRSDWQNERPEPPTAAEMLAYTRGELSPEEEARVQERLVSYPELVRTLTEPFPAEGAQPGDDDYLSDAEFEKHWAAMQHRLPRTAQPARVLQFWRATAALAATLALVFGAMLWQMASRSSQPRTISGQQFLFPEGRRGAPSDANTLTAQGDSILLVLAVNDERTFEGYRAAIVDADTNRVLWRSTQPLRREEDAVAIVVSRRFLAPGTYQIILYGGEQQIATYGLRVPRG